MLRLVLYTVYMYNVVKCKPPWPGYLSQGVSAELIRRISIRCNIYYLLELPRGGAEISGVNGHGKRLPYNQISEVEEKYG